MFDQLDEFSCKSLKHFYVPTYIYDWDFQSTCIEQYNVSDTLFCVYVILCHTTM